MNTWISIAACVKLGDLGHELSDCDDDHNTAQANRCSDLLVDALLAGWFRRADGTPEYSPSGGWPIAALLSVELFGLSASVAEVPGDAQRRLQPPSDLRRLLYRYSGKSIWSPTFVVRDRRCPDFGECETSGLGCRVWFLPGL